MVKAATIFIAIIFISCVSTQVRANDKIDALIEQAKTKIPLKQRIIYLEKLTGVECATDLLFAKCASRLEEISKDPQLMEAFKRFSNAGVRIALYFAGGSAEIIQITAEGVLTISLHTTIATMKNFLGL